MTTVSNLEYNNIGTAQPTPRYSLLGVGVKYISEEPFSAARTAQVLLTLSDQLDLIPEEHIETARNIRNQASLIKLVRFPGAFLKSVNTTRDKMGHLIDAVGAYMKKPSKEGSSEGRGFKVISTGFSTIRAANNIIPSINDGADFFTKAIFFIPKESIRPLLGITGGTLIFGMVCNIFESLDVIRHYKTGLKSSDDKEVTYRDVQKAMIKVAKEISYIALGILIVLDIFFGFVFSPITFTAWSTASVVFGLMEYFHNHWGQEIKSKKG